MWDALTDIEDKCLVELNGTSSWSQAKLIRQKVLTSNDNDRLLSELLFMVSCECETHHHECMQGLVPGLAVLRVGSEVREGLNRLNAKNVTKVVEKPPGQQSNLLKQGETSPVSQGQKEFDSDRLSTTKKFGKPAYDSFSTAKKGEQWSQFLDQGYSDSDDGNFKFKDCLQMSSNQQFDQLDQIQGDQFFDNFDTLTFQQDQIESGFSFENPKPVDVDLPALVLENIRDNHSDLGDETFLGGSNYSSPNKSFF